MAKRWLMKRCGGGDGAAPHQQFLLKKPPLTHVSAETPSGSEAELTVRVNGVAWEQAGTLYDLAPDAKSFIVRLDDEANARVMFGDGKMGARLPTGQENVRATYRSGIGLQGEVGAGTLTLLKKRPFGVRSVTNPLAADGAEDPETFAKRAGQCAAHGQNAGSHRLTARLRGFCSRLCRYRQSVGRRLVGRDARNWYT